VIGTWVDIENMGVQPLSHGPDFFCADIRLTAVKNVGFRFLSLRLSFRGKLSPPVLRGEIANIHRSSRETSAPWRARRGLIFSLWVCFSLNLRTSRT
jgi:hypothetical protein